ncbi:hypothetical protein [Desulfoscipio geothermicus]|uniref:Uncharacterized protein n=1 Tax=Desulfoscipio geothermicus DSM 3669 TaxID=1121426 RepID=A0A1I6E915_9FIRM|nr:hypothetical protein [Desulfoscipio geothermicus]SFR14220.1 hypothetical protein SAMN05660706_13032 [Desulfoscipio geothermicus DSM 3669]
MNVFIGQFAEALQKKHCFFSYSEAKEVNVNSDDPEKIFILTDTAEAELLTKTFVEREDDDEGFDDLYR